MKRYTLTESRLRSMIHEAVKSALYEQEQEDDFDLDEFLEDEWDEPQDKWGQKPYGFQDDENGNRIHVNHKGKVDGFNNGQHGWGRIEPSYPHTREREARRKEREVNGWEEQYESPAGYFMSRGSGSGKQWKLVPHSER